MEANLRVPDRGNASSIASGELVHQKLPVQTVAFAERLIVLANAPVLLTCNDKFKFYVPDACVRFSHQRNCAIIARIEGPV